MKKKILYVFLIFFFLYLIFFFYSKVTKKNITKDIEPSTTEVQSYNSNIIKDVNYSSKDEKGNEYIIDAEKGEIDYSNTNIIYLNNVRALIKLSNLNNITITSDFGKYNTDNYDTIFSKNVLIRYIDNKVTSEYLDFSINRNSMIISRDVVYSNLENVLTADVIEIDIKTKDTKIFMHEKSKKVNIKSKE